MKVLLMIVFLASCTNMVAQSDPVLRLKYGQSFEEVIRAVAGDSVSRCIPRPDLSLGDTHIKFDSTTPAWPYAGGSLYGIPATTTRCVFRNGGFHHIRVVWRRLDSASMESIYTRVRAIMMKDYGKPRTDGTKNPGEPRDHWTNDIDVLTTTSWHAAGDLLILNLEKQWDWGHRGYKGYRIVVEYLPNTTDSLEPQGIDD